MGHRFTEHALEALARRGFDATDVMHVLDAPEGGYGAIPAHRTMKFAKHGASS